MVVCLNQMDVAEGQGIAIDTKKLASLLGLPVVPTVAAKGKGIPLLIETAIQVAEGKPQPVNDAIRFGETVAASTAELTRQIESAHLNTEYSPRWLAIKLLEGDANVKEFIGRKSANLVQVAESLSGKMEEVYKQPGYVVMATERYLLASQIARDVQRQETVKLTVSDRIDRIATHKVYGYILSFAVIAGLLLWTFASAYCSFQQLVLLQKHQRQY